MPIFHHNRSISIMVGIAMAGLFLALGCERNNNLSADELIAKGRQAYSKGKVDNAVEFFKRALVLKPEDENLHYELGMIYDEECQKTYDTALQEVLKEVFAGRLKNSSNNEEQLIRHGYRKEFCDLAVSEFSAVLTFKSSNWRARYIVASNLLKRKQYAQAIPELKKVIQQKPDYPDSYGLIGRAYLETAQYELAERMLEKATRMRPTDYNYYLLGLVYKRANNSAKFGEIKKKLKEMKSIYYDSLVDPAS